MSNSMDCAEAAPLLDEYASGEVTGKERDALDEHVAHCADCRLSLHELGVLGTRIRALPTTSIPDDFLAQVHAKLPNQRFGLDQRATAPSTWLCDPVTTADSDERFLRFARIAA